MKIINNFFAKIGSSLSANMREENIILGPECVNEMTDFLLMNCSQFLEIVGDLKANKSSGIEDINSKLMLDFMRCKPDLFVKVINLSLTSGVFPTEWKIARICVIPKKGDIKNLDNLRPISLLSILGKIIEKFVKVQLVNFFEENDLFFNYQFGFRANRSQHP